MPCPLSGRAFYRHRLYRPRPNAPFRECHPLVMVIPIVVVIPRQGYYSVSTVSQPESPFSQTTACRTFEGVSPQLSMFLIVLPISITGIASRMGGDALDLAGKAVIE